jgi:hypothetical protein
VLEPLKARDDDRDGKNPDQKGRGEAMESENVGGCPKGANPHTTTTTAKATYGGTKQPAKPSLTWATAEDDTEMAGSNRMKIDRPEEEFLVKWQMPGTLDVSSAKKVLIHLLAELMTTFHDVIVIDNKKREWSFQREWISEGVDDEKFLKELGAVAVQIHPLKNQKQQITRWVAITKFRATSQIPDWKRNDFFYDQVIEAKVYMFPHPFQADEWEITSIGFIKEVHTIHFPSSHLHAMISDYVQSRDTNPPTFQLIPQKITNQDKTATTRAYTIQCAKTDAKRMSLLLTQGEFRTTKMFIPFKYKRQQPELFTKCIQQQNDVYYKTWVVKLEGISKEILHFISAEIHNLSGVFHVVPTNKYEETGEWKVLVDQTKSPFIHRQLQEKWNMMMSNVPENFLESTPSTWPAPCISSKKIRDYQDDASSNDSYGSLLTNGTNDSILTYGDDTLNDLPIEYKYPSYAKVAAPSTSTDTLTAFSSPTTSVASEWQKEKLEMESLLGKQAQLLEKLQSDQAAMLREIQTNQTQLIQQLRDDHTLQIENLQADLQAKITRSKDLEDQLAQAIELAYARNKKEDDMLQKFEMLMSRFSESTQDPSPYTPERNDQSTIFDKPHTTPPRTNTSKESPPPKKANTNVSPQRHMYTIFKPQSGRILRSSTAAKSPPRLLTQPMDVDHDSHVRPVPKANLGKKIE